MRGVVLVMTGANDPPFLQSKERRMSMLQPYVVAAFAPIDTMTAVLHKTARAQADCVILRILHSHGR
jgi:hypothetical protein